MGAALCQQIPTCWHPCRKPISKRKIKKVNGILDFARVCLSVNASHEPGLGDKPIHQLLGGVTWDF